MTSRSELGLPVLSNNVPDTDAARGLSLTSSVLLACPG